MVKSIISDYKTIFIIAVVVFISAFFALFGYYVYPAPGGDSLFFTLPGVNFAASHELTSPLFVDGRVYDRLIDTSGRRRFLHYPPLFPLALAYLMPQSTPRGAFMVISIIDVMVVVFSAIFIFITVRSGGALGWSSALLIGLSLFAVATTADQSGGRPEILARFIFALGLISAVFVGRKYLWLLFGVLIGLMGATHPPAGLIAGLLTLTLFSAWYSSKKTLLHTSSAFLVAVLVFLAVITVGPFEIGETLVAMRKMGNIVSSYLIENEAFNPKLFLTHYFFDPGAPFIGGATILLLACGIVVYRKNRNRIASPVLFFMGVILLVTMVFWLMFYIVGHQFYISVFSPLLFGGLVYYAARSGKFMKLTTAIIILLAASGIARDMFFFPSFLARGVKFADARSEFKDIQSRVNEGRFGVTSALWTLSENYNQMYTYTWPEVPEKDTPVIFLQQAYGGRLTPPGIPGCILVKNRFNAPPEIFGLKLGNSLRDYAYAIFECDSAAGDNGYKRLRAL